MSKYNEEIEILESYKEHCLESFEERLKEYRARIELMLDRVDNIINSDLPPHAKAVKLMSSMACDQVNATSTLEPAMGQALQYAVAEERLDRFEAMNKKDK